MGLARTTKGRHRVTGDGFNPRIYITETKCSKCKDWYLDEEIYYKTENGYETGVTPNGKPLCEGCLPETESLD